ncbi:hypothetical protein [Leptospira tipperaryensis]|nr:hypothetical protein [Leptospira tipperaryensis]
MNPLGKVILISEAFLNFIMVIQTFILHGKTSLFLFVKWTL